MREARSDRQYQAPLDSLLDVELKHFDNRVTAARNQPLSQPLANLGLNSRSTAE